MNASRLDAVNILLMLVSAVLALFIPFELFLFVYAILGPLHYLTEINWLHEKKYFLKNKNDYFFIVFFIFLLLVTVLFHLNFWIPFIIFSAFAVSFGILYFKSWTKRLLFILLVFLTGLLLTKYDYDHFSLLFSIFFPTIIHVFIFTSLFVLLGTLKSKSQLGLVSIIVFMSCTLVLLFINSSVNQSEITDYLTNSYSGFRNLNYKLIEIFDYFNFTNVIDNLKISNATSGYNEVVYFSDFGIKVMRFVAFAYTYHYLNWFSKTSIIQWHKTSRNKLIVIICLWIASVSIYLYNYNIGLQWLYLLSISHVLLEFPLNHKSFVDIKNHLKMILIK